jgi:hypothetical protein
MSERSHGDRRPGCFAQRIEIAREEERSGVLGMAQKG